MEDFNVLKTKLNNQTLAKMDFGCRIELAKQATEYKEIQMEISKLTFAGTVEEFPTVEHLFASVRAENVKLAQHDSLPDGNDKGRDEVIRDVIRRIPVPFGQRQLYKVLDKAGDHGLSKPKLVDAMGLSEREFAGVLGALGKRIKGSAEEGISLFLQKTEVDGTWNYRLWPEVREVLKMEGII